MNEENRFYVYAWIRNDINKIFYIGKGSNNRITDLSMRNKHFINIVNKIGLENCTQIKLEEGLNEQKAFEREKYYVAYYRSLKEPLTNICDGGEGSSGWFNSLNEEDKEKHRQISKSFKGKHHTEETKKKMSKSALKSHRHLSQNSKDKISKANSIGIDVYYNNKTILYFKNYNECVEYFNNAISADAIRNAIYKNDGFIRSKYKKHLKFKQYQFKLHNIKTQSTIENIT